MLNIKVNRENFLKTIKTLLTGEMEQEIKTVIENDAISMYEKSSKISKIINIYEEFYNILSKSILKKLFFVQFLKKFNLSSLFLSFQIRDKFKIYNLN